MRAEDFFVQELSERSHGVTLLQILELVRLLQYRHVNSMLEKSLDVHPYDNHQQTKMSRLR